MSGEEEELKEFPNQENDSQANLYDLGILRRTQSLCLSHHEKEFSLTLPKGLFAYFEEKRVKTNGRVRIFS